MGYDDSTRFLRYIVYIFSKNNYNIVMKKHCKEVLEETLKIYEASI